MKKTMLCFLLLMSVSILAQETTKPKEKYRKTMPVFIEIGAGINNSKFIDFATSPLYYSGFLRHVSGSYKKETEKREVFYNIGYSFGSYSLEYNSLELSSDPLANFNIRHTRLYQIDAFSDEKWNLKVGGTIDARGLGRLNPALMNNQFGADLFVNLMASGKVSKDISNSSNKKFWFVKAKAKERKLSYQLDLGLINSTYRNGYIYSNSQPVYNPNASLFGAHEFLLFSGFRMSSRFDYEHAISNNNTLKFSYIWDAMMSGNKESDRFQLVNNIFLVSLNIKIR